MMGALCLVAMALVSGALGCGSGGAQPAASDRAPAALSELASRAPLTVLVFFTAECPVQKAHDARLREIASAYAPRGVAFVAMISEREADIEAARAEVRRRGLPVEVREDRGALAADALGVEYSTHAVVLDRANRVLYSGAIDGDRTHLTDGAERYLVNALDAALAGRPAPRTKTEALGCPIAKH